MSSVNKRHSSSVWLLEFAAAFLGIDLMANNSYGHAPAGPALDASSIELQASRIQLWPSEQTRGRRRPVAKSHWFRTRAQRRWPRAIMALYCACVAHLTAHLYYQYQHDILVMQLKRLRGPELTEQPERSEQPERTERLETATAEAAMRQRANQVRRTLKLIGSPMLNAHFVGECLLLIAIGNSFLFYLVPRFAFGGATPCDFGWPRRLVALDTERRNFVNYLTSLIQNFHQSRRNFVAAAQRRRLAPPAPSETVTQSAIGHVIERGELTPNNLATGWVGVVHTWYGFGLAVMFGSCLATLALLASVLLDQPAVAIGGCSDTLILAEIGFVLAVSCSAATVLYSLFVVSLAEQLLLIGVMRKHLKRALVLNCGRFETMCALKSGAQLRATLANMSPLKQVRHQMNLDLLCSLLRYKIYVAHLGPTLAPNGCLLLLASVTLTVYTLDCLLHNAYVDQAEFPTFMRSEIVFCVAVMFVSLLCFALGCSLLERSKHVHKLVFSLHSHAIQTRHHNIYDPHTVDALRRELAHPDCVLEQFGYRFWWLRCNWPNTLRLYLWVGVMFVYSVLEHTDSRSIISSVVKDPLGLLT